MSLAPTCDFELEARKARGMTTDALRYAILDAQQAARVCTAECQGKYTDQISVYRQELNRRK